MLSPFDARSPFIVRHNRFNPASLFAVDGSRGGFWKPSDWSTLAANTNGTGAISTAGQSVAFIRDLSGLGNHFTQVSAASRALTSTYLDGAGNTRRAIGYDGLDDFYVTPQIDFSNSDEITVIVGLRKLSDAAIGTVIELTTSTTANNGAFLVRAPAASSASYGFSSKGTVITSAAYSNAAVAAPNIAVLSGESKVSTNVARLSVNAVSVATSAADQGTGNFANAAIYAGRRGNSNFPFVGDETYIYVINRLLPADIIAAIISDANSVTGAY